MIHLTLFNQKGPRSLANDFFNTLLNERLQGFKLQIKVNSTQQVSPQGEIREIREALEQQKLVLP